MRLTHTFAFLLLIMTIAAAQQPKTSNSVTDEDFQKVLVAVSDEQWDTGVDLSSKFLKLMTADDKRLPRLRYIYLYSAAGKVSEGRMEFDDLSQAAKQFVGTKVVLPYRPITLECRGAMNFICPSPESKDRFMVAATNKTGTTILAFEYVQLKEPFDFASHEDEPASIVGNIQAVVPNPNKSRAIVMRLFISEAVIELKERPSKKAFPKTVPDETVD